jgi:7-carboxy-7-deazaguanine synthase
MNINEIFYSIQGEGKWIGLPNIFIRTSGCNLRCSFCDTKFAYYEYKKMSKEDILTHIYYYPCKHICITGGEPLLQNETFDLIDILIKKKYKICLETNGSINIKKIIGDKSLMISMDIKCPSSNMHDKMLFENIQLLKRKDQLKFIIKNKEDYSYAKNIINTFKPYCTVFFQPEWKTNSKYLASWLLKDGLNARLGLQLHKILWGDIRKL